MAVSGGLAERGLPGVSAAQASARLAESASAPRTGTTPETPIPNPETLLSDRIQLQRNGELILANPLNPRLLYFPENGQAIAALLRRLEAMVEGSATVSVAPTQGERSNSPRRIACRAPMGDEAQFVQMLRAHGLMGPAPAPASGKMVSQCASERVSECASGTVSQCASERVSRAPAAVPGGGPARENPFAAELAALTKRMLANRDRFSTLYLCFGGPEGASLSTPVAMGAIQAAVGRLAERAELEVVFHGGEPLARLADIQTVVAETKANPVAQEKKIKLAFRISTPLSVIPDGFAGWARRMDVAILAQPPTG